MSFFKKIFGDNDNHYLKSIASLVSKINLLENNFSSVKDEDFLQKTEELKRLLITEKTLDDILPEAFALVREAAKRTLKLRHYDVQLIGGITLHRGKIAEMMTGEGKTLVATLPVYLNALAGKGVHVVTVNDYLARRDAVWMGVIYSFLGLSVGVVNSQNVSFLYDPQHKEEDRKEDEVGAYKIVYEHLRPCTRKEAYAADITYGTNHEFGFDYLRDNLASTVDQLVQREHSYAVVDEVDSILIDEARTPLIISSESSESEDLYTKFASIAKNLEKEIDFTIDEKLRAISLTDEGINKAEKILGIENIYTEKGIKYVHHLENATRAEALFFKDKDYVVHEGEVIIVDSFTGRLQPGRRWSDGLHQAIEAKENVEIQKETRTAASITFQNYFRFYQKLSGMTGTAKTSSEELFKVYGLEVISIPTNVSSRRIDRNDLIFQTEKGKFKAIAKKVKELQKMGQPVLIGTVSIEKNELLSAYLIQEGVQHIILNAKNHEKEGEIIAQAGKKGAVTIATNMAGRGVDIKLGGQPCTKEENEEVKKLGGLFVLGTERHEARRIDNQLRGRAARQGDQGETQFFVSLEDDLMRIFGAERIKKMMGRFGIPEEQPIENSFISHTLEKAQAKIEGFNFDARKYTLEFDDVMNYQRKIVYDRRKKMLAGDKEYIKEYLEKIKEEDISREKIINEKKNLLGEENFLEMSRRIILYVTNILWSEHLELMDYTRASVNLRSYGQRDPLVEYKKEGSRLFKEMEEAMKEQIFSLIETMGGEAREAAQEVEVVEEKEFANKHQEFKMFEATPVEEKKENLNNIKKEEVGRNDSCPCGSGKKYKKCCMKVG